MRTFICLVTIFLLGHFQIDVPMIALFILAFWCGVACWQDISEIKKKGGKK